MTKVEPLSHSDLHSHLLTHEFLYKTSLLSMAVNPYMLPTPSLLPFTYLAQHQHNAILVVIKVILATTGAPIITDIAANTCMIFMVLISLFSLAGSKVTGSRPNDLLVLGSGLLTNLLSKTSCVSFASLLATPPYNVLNFAAVATNPLLILLLALFLPLLGS